MDPMNTDVLIGHRLVGLKCSDVWIIHALTWFIDATEFGIVLEVKMKSDVDPQFVQMLLIMKTDSFVGIKIALKP